MNGSAYNKNHKYILYLITSSLLFFVSFLRAAISLSIVAMLPIMSTLLVIVLLFSPIAITLLLNKMNLNHPIILSTLWILGIILSLLQISLIFRFYLSLLGLGFSINEISTYLRLNHLQLNSILITFLSIDFLLKMFNYGQEPLINISTTFYTSFIVFFIILLGISSVYMNIKYYSITKESMTTNNPINNRYKNRELSFFLLIFIYIFQIANAHILIWDTGLSLIQSLIIGSILFLSSIFLFTILNNVTSKVALISVFTLTITLNMYPWNNITIYFWLLNILSFMMIFSFIFNNDVKKYSKYDYSIIGYLLLILLIYFLLIFESYILFSIISLLLILFLNNNHNNYLKLGISLKHNRLIYFILIFSILIVPIIFHSSDTNFISQNQDNFRVLSYNIHYGTDYIGFDATDRLIDFINLYKPTIIALQEVSVSTPLNGFGNIFGKLIVELASLGYNYYVISSGGKYSLVNAIFSIFPISWTVTIDIDPVVEYQRTAIIANIELRDDVITVISTHLTNVGGSDGTIERLSQVKYLIKQISSQENISNNLILAGDFNSKPISEEYDTLSNIYSDSWKNWVNGSDETGYTSPSEKPNKRIDYIFYQNLKVMNFLLIQTTISDHLPLICDYELIIRTK